MLRFQDFFALAPVLPWTPSKKKTSRTCPPPFSSHFYGRIFRKKKKLLTSTPIFGGVVGGKTASHRLPIKVSWSWSRQENTTPFDLKKHQPPNPGSDNFLEAAGSFSTFFVKILEVPIFFLVSFAGKKSMFHGVLEVFFAPNFVADLTPKHS